MRISISVRMKSCIRINGRKRMLASRYHDCLRIFFSCSFVFCIGFRIPVHEFIFPVLFFSNDDKMKVPERLK